MKEAMSMMVKMKVVSERMKSMLLRSHEGEEGVQGGWKVLEIDGRGGGGGV